MVCGGEQTGVNEREKKEVRWKGLSREVLLSRQKRVRREKILKTFIPTSRWDGEQAVGVQLEEEEVERLMDVMHAFNLEEAQSVCVCCVSVAHMP